MTSANDNTLPRQLEFSDDAFAADQFNALSALIAELRERLDPISEDQWDQVGTWMLKAYWLGEGRPMSEVFKHRRS